MDNYRVILWGALAALLYLNFLTWQHDYAPPPEPSPAATTTQQKTPTDTLPELPNAASPSEQAAAPAAATPSAPASAIPAAAVKAEKIRVVTDVLDLEVSLRGGELDRADLVKYPQVKDQPEPVRLLDVSAAAPFVERSGLRAAASGMADPNHTQTFSAAQTEYRLAPGAKELRVPLTWTDGKGITVTKTYVFHAGGYAIELEYEVDNATQSDWKGASYVQIVRHYEPVKRSYFNVESYAYRGPAIYNGNKYQRLNIDKDEDKKFHQSVSGGWIAALQHHFVVAATPTENAPYDFQLAVNANNDFTLSYVGPVQTVAAGKNARFHERLFVGPKLQSQLEAAGPGLERTTDYGRLAIIAQPLFWLLDFVHKYVGNWGLSIMLVTLLLKLAFYKLSETSGRSAAKMRNLAPRLKTMQERFKDDREQLGRATMELYRKEKINPLAGCLPMVIQMPVFIAFYWVLQESVEMRQAPFFGWITDLSARDPFFILPLINGAAMYFQFKLNPPSADPMQAKIFAIMPLIFTATMAFFPAGLVIYWITNTGLSILQQWRINKIVSAEQKKT
jgi:YidC/Oxa1 family membrane protein insertase